VHRRSRKRFGRIALELANALAFLVALTGAAIELSNEVETEELAGACVLVVVLYALLTAVRLWPDRYVYKTGSKKYVKGSRLSV
jgi:hypothetical protein